MFSFLEKCKTIKHKQDCRDASEGIEVAHIVTSSHFGRSEFGVVRATTSWMNPPASDSLRKNGIVDIEVDHLVHLHALLLKHGIELHGKTTSEINLANNKEKPSECGVTMAFEITF